MAEKPQVAVREVNTINIKHVESDLKMLFDEADFSVENEEEFEKNCKSWFKAEFNRSLHQAAEVLDKMYPNQEADKGILLDTRKQTMQHKVEFLENYLKLQSCKFV